MKLLQMSISLVLVGCAATPSENPGPFEKHILDALELNEMRKPVYSAMSDARSTEISRRLIYQEKMSIGIAQEFDRRAQYYRDLGIPLLEHEFVSLSQIEDLDPSKRGPGFDPKTFLAKDRRPQYRKIVRELRDAYHRGGLALLSKKTSEHLDRLNEFPKVYCMTRHFLESIRRAANLGSLHQAQAETINESTEWLTWKFIDLHLSYLGDAVSLDLLAIPIQAKGINIICGDIPEIPAW